MSWLTKRLFLKGTLVHYIKEDKERVCGAKGNVFTRPKHFSSGDKQLVNCEQCLKIIRIKKL